MTLEPHRYIKGVRVETEGNPPGPVTIITTGLNINRDNPAYDPSAMDELTKHVEEWQRHSGQMATIEGPT